MKSKFTEEQVSWLYQEIDKWGNSIKYSFHSPLVFMAKLIELELTIAGLIENLDIKIIVLERPEFTKEQEYFLCGLIGDWYLDAKELLKGNPHNLGSQKEFLKMTLCGKLYE